MKFTVAQRRSCLAVARMCNNMRWVLWRSLPVKAIEAFGEIGWGSYGLFDERQRKDGTAVDAQQVATAAAFCASL